MPDHLPRPDGFQGDTSDDVEKALENEQEWLRSNIRAFVDMGSSEPLPKREKQYRLSAYWFLVLVDCVLRARCSQGLEAFLSKETCAKIQELAKRGISMTALFVYSGARVQKLPLAAAMAFLAPRSMQYRRLDFRMDSKHLPLSSV
jgi:hypothetical protein